MAALLAGCQGRDTDSLAAAKESIAAKDTASAIVHLKNVLAKNPEQAEARLLLGRQELVAGNPALAVVDLRRARELKVPDEQVVPDLAEALAASGQAKLMLEMLEKVTLREPNAAARLAASLAVAHSQLGSADLARTYLDKALAADPKSIPVQLTQVQLTMRAGDRAKALKLAEAVVAQSPDSDDAWSLLGDLKAQVPEEAAAAEAAYAKALAINPKQPAGLVGKLAIQITRNDLKAARDSLAALTKAWPQSFQGQYYEARLNHLDGKYAEARAQYAGLLAAAPDSAAVQLAAGINELRLKAATQAQVMLARAVSLEPSNPAARFYLAQANMQLGRPQEATANLQPLIDSGIKTVAVYSLAGQARLLQGDSRGAESLFAAAAAIDPKDVGLRTAMAALQAYKGNADVALRELQVISAASDQTDADLRLISGRMAREEYDQALEAVENLRKKQPDQPAAYELRGQVLLKQGKADQARAAFEEALNRDPYYTPAITQLAEMDAADKRWDAARARMDALQAHDPRDARVLVSRASLETRAGATPAEVMKWLDKAVKADPLDVMAWQALIARQFISGDVVAALSSATAATQAVPDNIVLMDALGRCQLRANDGRQASATYASLIRLAPGYTAGYLGLTAALISTGDLNAAGDTVKRLMAMDDRSLEGQKLAVEIALKRKQFNEATAVARNVQKQYPNDAIGYVLEADVQMQQARWEAASDILRKALDKRDAGPAAQRLYATLNRAGKRPDAEQVAAAWMKAHPDDRVYLGYLTFAAIGEKDYARAKTLLEQSIKLAPDSAPDLNNLAWILLETKQPGAVSLAERAVALLPTDPNMLDTLAQAYAAEKQWAKATEALTRAIQRAPDPSPLRVSLAQVYIQAGERDKAISELQRVVDLGANSPQFAKARRMLAEQRSR